MDAVLDVVRNRMNDDRFPADACAVIRQEGQFQPVSEWPKLARLLAQPERLDAFELLGPSESLKTAFDLAEATERSRITKGALYFLNTRLMDPAYCPWFSRLKRTGQIGEHVFMTEYVRGETRGAPALDCDDPSIGSGYGRSMAVRYANGLFDPAGPKVAINTPTRNQLKAWKRTGELERRQKELKKAFKPGWIELN